MHCKDCGTYVRKYKNNQKRCGDCIAENPHRGRHAVGKLGEKYIAQAKIRLKKNILHWKVSMGMEKRIKMFPDIVEE